MESMRTKPKICVIGSGISGISAAWLLRLQADVTLYEASPRFGGHTHTYAVEEESKTIPIDTGFMVFNRENYPNLVQLFQHLQITSYPTNMSFSVSLDSGNHEYAGSGINGLFGQRSNLLKAGHWRMLRDVLRFNQSAQQALDRLDDDIRLGDFLNNADLGSEFRHLYLYPMAAAIWSCPREWIQEFPASRFMRFFANHGLLSVNNHLQWYTVEGGSSTYLRKMLDDLGPAAVAQCPVVSVKRDTKGVGVCTAAGETRFDQVVFACHSDQTLSLLTDPTPSENRALSAIPYQANRVILHSDERLMPARRRVWSSWNFIADKQTSDSVTPASVSYWMNSLQQLATNKQYFVSLNPTREPAKDLHIAEFEYHHPVFGHDSITGQQLVQEIQGKQHTWYCGAWLGYGFHEDGLKSGIDVAKKLGAKIPWEENRPAQIIQTPMPRHAA
jgi:predicted NAD/FAD-binding protein